MIRAGLAAGHQAIAIRAGPIISTFSRMPPTPHMQAF